MHIPIPPAWVLGFLIASLYGTAFHIWRGESLQDLSRFLIAAWIGFGLAQWGSYLADLMLVRIGQLDIASATLGAWLALFIARRL
ncbi:MAG: hypothetical protein GXP39_03710 [Chloroflexi bacterium]|nr:hypothetical protein [Chloroflexota bacterium]